MSKLTNKQISGIILLILGFICLIIAIINIVAYMQLEGLAETSIGFIWEDLGEILVFASVGRQYIYYAMIFFISGIVLLIISIFLI